MKLRGAPNIGLIIAAVLVVFGFVISWHIFGKLDPYESLLPGNQTLGEIPIQMTDVEVQARSNGFPSWHAHAASFEISADRRSMTATNLDNGIFYSDRRPVLMFSANRVQSLSVPFRQQPDVVVDGEVDFWTKGNSPKLPIALHVSTKHIEWNGSTGAATCSGPVQFEAQKLGSGSATGLTFDAQRKTVRFGQFTAVSNVKLVDDVTMPSALPAKPAAAANSLAASQSNDLTWTATDGYWDENNQVLSVKGPITFRQGKAQVEMVGATYDEKTSMATSSSPIKFTDDNTTLTGDHGTINFSSHIAILSGNITMLVLPKPGDAVKEAAAKKPTTILCDQINYNYRLKKAHTSGQVIIKQTGRTVTADDGQYDVAMKIVDLTGDVVGKTTDGKVIMAPHAQLSVDPQDEWMKLDGPIKGSDKVPDSDNPLATGQSASDTESTSKSTSH